MNTSAQSMCSILLIALAMLPASGFSQEKQLEYTVDSSMIEFAKIVRTPHGYASSFRLKEAYQGEFAKLTGENVGRELTVYSGGRVLVRSIIQGQINSGRFSAGPFPTREEAEALIREVMPGILEIPGPESPQSEPSEMDLQPGMLLSAKILKTARGHEVVFRFMEAYRPLFADLTRGSIGRRLVMRCNGRVIATLDIQGEISDGAFTGNVFPTREDAEALIREVLPGTSEMPDR